MPLIELSQAEQRAVRWPSPAALAIELSRGKWTLARHLDFISRILRDSIVGKHGRLILTIPPRHGKSELCSVWLVVWLLAMKKDARVAVITYGHSMAATWGRKIRDILREHGDALGVHLNPDKRSENEFETAEGGLVICTGIGGQITGKGFDLILFDDPYKGREEADSEAERRKVKTFWTDTCFNRIEPGGSVVVIMQRWREDDLVGYMLSDEDPVDWTLINIPAIIENEEDQAADPLGREMGEPLWPERYSTPEWDAKHPTGTDWNDLTPFKSWPRSWSSQFQQRPAPDDGDIFQRDKFRYFVEDGGEYVLRNPDGEDKRVPKSACPIYQTADTAWEDKEDNDYSACLTFAVTPTKEMLVLEVVREKKQFMQILPWLIAQRHKWNPAWQGVEKKASGQGLVPMAASQGYPMKILVADKSKELRAVPATILYENGMLYHRAGAPWLGEFEHELLMFNNGNNDDQVDCLAYAAREVGTPSPYWVQTL